MERDVIWWWTQYIHWCKRNNWDFTKESYEEYKENMKKVRAEVEKNDLLSQN